MAGLQSRFRIRYRGNHAFVLEKSIDRTELPTDQRGPLKVQDIFKALKDDLDARLKSGKSSREMQAQGRNPAISYIYIHCDELILDHPETSILAAHSWIRWLRITARSLLVLGQGDHPRVKFPFVMFLTFIAQEVPNGLEVECTVKQGLFKVLHRRPGDAIGMTYKISDGSLPSWPVPPLQPLETRKLTTEDFELDYQGQRSIEHILLARLLFDKTTELGSVWQSTEKTKPSELKQCLSTYRFILMLLKGSTDQVDLVSQTTYLLRRLELPAKTGYFVPPLAPFDAYFVLDQWLSSVKEATTQIKELKLESETVQNANKVVGDIIGALNNKFLLRANIDEAAARKQAQRAAMAVQASADRFEQAQAITDGLSRDFRETAAAWQQKQEEKAREEKMWQYFTLAVDIGVAIYTAHSAGVFSDTKALSAAGKAQKDLDSELKKHDHVGVIKDIAERMGKVQEAMAVTKEFLDELYKKPSDTGTEPMAASDGAKKASIALLNGLAKRDIFDWFELMTLWADFKLENEQQFQALEKLNIPGTQALKLNLMKMIVRGEYLIQAHREAQEAREKLTQAMNYSAALNPQPDSTDASQVFVSVKPATPTVQATRAYMEESLTSVKRQLFVAFYEWVSAWSFASGRQFLPNIPVPSVRTTIANYRESISTTSSALINSKTRALRTGELPLVLSTNDMDSIFEKEWKQQLISNKQVLFNIPFLLAKAPLQSYVQQAWVKLKGLAAKPPPSEALKPNLRVNIDVEFGPILGQSVEGDTGSIQSFRYYTFPTTHRCVMKYLDASAEKKVLDPSVDQKIANTSAQKKVSDPAVATEAKFQDTDDREKSFRPSLYSNGRLVLKPLVTGSMEKQEGIKGLEWDVTSVTELEMTLIYEYSPDQAKA